MRAKTIREIAVGAALGIIITAAIHSYFKAPFWILYTLS